MNATRGQCPSTAAAAVGLAWRCLLALLLSVLARSAMGFCYAEAAQRYQLPAELLRAIALVESGERHLPPSRNANGTVDIGVMRINSGWLPRLAQYNIDEKKLSEDACLSVMVGAWILALNRAQLGNSWNAVGAYNVGCRKMSHSQCQALRQRYVLKVARAALRPQRS